MSDQRLTITVYGAGELVPAFDILGIPVTRDTSYHQELIAMAACR
jgi:hypothetical protein